MYRCGIYARVSTDKQGDSIENQVSQAREYIRRMGENYEVLDECIFIDNATSGYFTSVFDREAMKQAIDLAKKKMFDVLVFKEISRVGRDKQENPAIVGMFEQYGVRVIAINDNYDSLNKDNITFGILSVLAEQESRKTSVRVSSAMKEKARRGEWTTTAPIGYKINKQTKKLEIDEDKKWIIEDIFNQYVNSEIGTFLIAQSLNDRGVRTSTGHLFTRGAIKRILVNKAYIGHSIFGKKRNELQRTYEDDGRMTKKKIEVKVDPSEWIEVKNSHPAIIDERTFYAAQEKLNGRAHHRTPRRAYHPLTGILVCGKCGEGMVCQRRNVDGKEYRYYICKTYHKYGRATCDQKNINAAHIEPYVVDDLKIALEELIKSRMDSKTTRSSDSIELEKTLLRLEKEKEKLKKDQLDTFQQRDLFTTEVYEELLRTIKNRSESLIVEMDIVTNKIELNKNEENNLDALNLILDELKTVDITDLGRVRALMHKTIKRVTVLSDDELHIEYMHR